MFALVQPIAVLQTLQSPSFGALISSAGGPREQAIQQTAVSAAIDLVAGGAQFLFGWLFKHVDSWVMFTVGIGLNVICVIVTAFLPRWIHKPK